MTIMLCPYFNDGRYCMDGECLVYGCAHERAERVEKEWHKGAELEAGPLRYQRESRRRGWPAPSDPRRLIAENGDDVAGAGLRRGEPAPGRKSELLPAPVRHTAREDPPDT